MVDKVSRVERETNLNQMRSMARAMVMEEMQTKMSDALVQQQVPHMTPLPSLHRLPSPPPTSHCCRGADCQEEGAAWWAERRERISKELVEGQGKESVTGRVEE